MKLEIRVKIKIMSEIQKGEGGMKEEAKLNKGKRKRKMLGRKTKEHETLKD